jgi:hypothetical protein
MFKNPLRLTVALTVGCLVALPAGWIFSKSTQAPRPTNLNAGPSNAPDALREELSAIATRYHRDWDKRRDDASDGPDRARLREEWRAAYAKEVRDAYARHDKPAPEWALRD